MQFLFGPLIGNVSDAVGRRPVLLLWGAGLGFDDLATALAPSLPWLFAGRMVAGICGASVITVDATIADVTPPEDRGRAFGLIGAAFGVGFVIGPALGGLVGQFGSRAPFLVAAGLSLLNFALATRPGGNVFWPGAPYAAAAALLAGTWAVLSRAAPSGSAPGGDPGR